MVSLLEIQVRQYSPSPYFSEDTQLMRYFKQCKVPSPTFHNCEFRLPACSTSIKDCILGAGKKETGKRNKTCKKILKAVTLLALSSLKKVKADESEEVMLAAFLESRPRLHEGIKKKKKKIKPYRKGTASFFPAPLISE